ncbi:MAG: type II toxin-antitoxin system RelE/ParE family toxin [Chloroflexi bacterium]|nr:type II toxin-antitoxin system RelE/ParE family toxin [Chloroflexota bacterium]
MEVTFRSKQLKLCYEESAKAVQKWGQAVGRKYITRINELYAVKDFQDAYNIRSMRLHALKGGRKGELSINLTGQWRLIVTKGETEEHVIVQNVSNHYED